jgi:hypothetical protein
MGALMEYFMDFLHIFNYVCFNRKYGNEILKGHFRCLIWN